MNKILLIIAREYLSRVRKRSFIIMSLIGPVLFGAMFIVPVWLASKEGDDKIIEVIDESGYYSDHTNEPGALKLLFTHRKVEEAREDLKSDVIQGILYIPPFSLDNPQGIDFIVQKNPGLETQSRIEYFLNSKIEELRIRSLGLDKATLDSIHTNVSLSIVNISDKEEKKGDAAIATAVGYVSALMIYMFILMYGVQTLRGVIEEKTSRIVEVIISSVKPIQLMIGKIVGIGAVGLTQFIIWIFLTTAIYQFASLKFKPAPDQITTGINIEQQQTASQMQVIEIMDKIDTINFPLLVGSFLFFFITAYLFYGALYAAIGSSVDSDADAQQFQWPMTLPLLASVMFLAPVLRDPHGSFAFWTSIIPFFAPVVMMMRIPFDPPAWHILLSMAIMVIGFVGSAWVAGRIYRVGILLHGTKVSFKKMFQWLFLKN